eukprot:COSAG05_NODE_2916_length_2512_cov_3.769996_2_plen_194_part_00
MKRWLMVRWRVIALSLGLIASMGQMARQIRALRRQLVQFQTAADDLRHQLDEQHQPRHQHPEQGQKNSTLGFAAFDAEQPPRVVNLLIVFATSFYGEVRTEKENTHMCRVDQHTIINVTDSYNMSFAADADGLIYYGPDIFHADIPPFGTAAPGWAATGYAYSLPIPLMNHTHPYKNKQVPIFYSVCNTNHPA